MKLVILYVPVMHKGYEDFLRRHSDASEILIFGPETIKKFDWLRKDLRQLSPEIARTMIRSLGFVSNVYFFEEMIESLPHASEIVMPDETECRMLFESELSGLPVRFESTKLRYDKKRTESQEEVGAIEVNLPQFVGLMGVADYFRKKSPDWWIQVGAMLVRDGDILVTGWNKHRPTDREALYMGDPRSNYTRGVSIELSIADHAEIVVFAEAARRGIRTEGCDLFVTTFPCPHCAGLIRLSGVKRLFFARGYSLVSGEELLRSANIEIFRVKEKINPSD